MTQEEKIDFKHPNDDDLPNGRYIEDADDKFYIQSWWHWDGKDFGGIVSTWIVSDWDISLVTVYTKLKGKDWVREDDTTKANFLPDRHKRIARELGRERFKLSQFYRLKLD